MNKKTSSKPYILRKNNKFYLIYSLIVLKFQLYSFRVIY